MTRRARASRLILLFIAALHAKFPRGPSPKVTFAAALPASLDLRLRMQILFIRFGLVVHPGYNSRLVREFSSVEIQFAHESIFLLLAIVFSASPPPKPPTRYLRRQAPHHQFVSENDYVCFTRVNVCPRISHSCIHHHEGSLPLYFAWTSRLLGVVERRSRRPEPVSYGDGQLG